MIVEAREELRSMKVYTWYLLLCIITSGAHTFQCTVRIPSPHKSRANRMCRERQWIWLDAAQGGVSDDRFSVDGLSVDPLPLTELRVIEVEGRAVLPGYRDVMNIHEPRWLSFFNDVLETHDPPNSVGTYGHLLRDRTIGTVMTILDFRRIDDGSIIVVAQAHGKFELGQPLLRSDDNSSALVGSAVPVEAALDLEVEALCLPGVAQYWEAAWSQFDLPLLIGETARKWPQRGLNALAPFANDQLSHAALHASCAAITTVPRRPTMANNGGSSSKVVKMVPPSPPSTRTGLGLGCLEALEAAETQVWDELALFVSVAGRLRTSKTYALPAALIYLRPGGAPAKYSSARRAWRLSYAVAHILDLDKAEGRQSILEHDSVLSRLTAVLEELQAQRKMMAAALMLEEIRASM
eukprot:CAMPEP_0185750268 /NCGR_PEP_ID=MMETSP1174-20130828/9038_1 /TAXON_ID=35687 /ORGANISM="Dictyocha speculum, Strain CCMP1381" /LENGTH=408 /DNA_ID=CAMNT_0028426757 /DNA_START=22 /DNA_END=1246 /DNA_ORIENTATION=-